MVNLLIAIIVFFTVCYFLLHSSSWLRVFSSLIQLKLKCIYKILSVIFPYSLISEYCAVNKSAIFNKNLSYRKHNFSFFTFFLNFLISDVFMPITTLLLWRSLPTCHHLSYFYHNTSFHQLLSTPSFLGGYFSPACFRHINHLLAFSLHPPSSPLVNANEGIGDIL